MNPAVVLVAAAVASHTSATTQQATGCRQINKLYNKTVNY